MSQLSFVIVAALLCTTVCTGQCAAEIVAFSNLGPRDNYHLVGNQLGVSTNSSIGYYAETKLAQRFTPSASGRLSKLELLLTFGAEWTPGLPNVDELTLRIAPDENGMPGSTELWSNLFVNQAYPYTEFPDSNTMSGFEVDNGITLQEGVHYWLTATTTSVGNDPYVWWYAEYASTEPRARYWIHGNSPDLNGKWLVNELPEYGYPEFGLAVTVIPEPAAAALILAASAALLAVRRRTSL